MTGIAEGREHEGNGGAMKATRTMKDTEAMWATRTMRDRRAMSGMLYCYASRRVLALTLMLYCCLLFWLCIGLVLLWY